MGMSYDLSACVFIKDNFKGAFCLFESIAQLMPLADEFIVMDLGSSDGTIEVLEEIKSHNNKLKIAHDRFYENDASVFAELANRVVNLCEGRRILYYQADEIWHEDLIEYTKDVLTTDAVNLSFWRYQLKHNFQKIKWYPHIVHRIGTKESLDFTDDGMNTKQAHGALMCSRWGSEHFLHWGDRYKDNPVDLPTQEMILDISLTGGFLENIFDRRRMHAPFWNENIDIPSMPADEGGIAVGKWVIEARNNSDWYKKTTEFNIPQIMRYHVGKQRYELRPGLLEILKSQGSIGEWR